MLARLCREREGRSAHEGVGVGGKEESHGGNVGTQHDRGVTPVLNMSKENIVIFLSGTYF